MKSLLMIVLFPVYVLGRILDIILSVGIDAMYALDEMFRPKSGEKDKRGKA